MKQESLEFAGLPALLWGERAERAYLYVHGQGGSKEEAAAFAAAACRRGWQVLSVDLPGHGVRTKEGGAFDPWHVVPELEWVLECARARWAAVSLYAVSIGAWFSMLAFAGQPLERCLLVSPVLDMPALIGRMMGWAGVSEEQLKTRRIIPTAFGQTLSWEYLRWARQHPIREWRAPTRILYAGRDELTDRSTADAFAARFGCALTVMEEGEHWFHTPEELAVLRHWEQEQLQENGTGALIKSGAEALAENLERLHTTPLGIERIRKNLSLKKETDVVEWCREKIRQKGTTVVREGKNWYAVADDCEITVNARSFTIITAHSAKGRRAGLRRCAGGEG